MVSRIVTGIKVECISLHIALDVFSLDVVAQTVCICEEQIDVVVLWPHVFVVKTVHQWLAEVQDGHSNVDRFVEH